MSRTRAVAVLVLLSALGLVGCSGDDPVPKFEPPASEAPTSPSTTAASGPIEPTMPPEAKGSDAAAAEAFLKFFWEMVNYAQASGDLEGLKSLGDEKCRACQGGIDYLEQVEQKGGEIVGGDGTVAIRQTGFLSSGDAAIRFTLKTTRQTVDYPGTAKDETYSGGSSVINATLRPTSDGWLMLSWNAEQ